MAGRPIRISIIANGRAARADLIRTGASVDRLNTTVGRLGKVVGGAFAISGLIRTGKAIVGVGNEYTSQLAKIQALTTKQQRDQVGGMQGVAKQIEAQRAGFARYGSDVGDAAAGVTELVKAGQSLPAALKSINATLVLAKAGEMDVADASSLVATALTTWHMPAKRAGDIANYLANAANISTADVSDLGEALKFVAPIAADAGISAKQTAAYLAQLSNAGINGTLAGTGLRKVMESLQSPTGAAGKQIRELGLEVFDAEGKARPFSAVMGDLADKLDGLTQQERKKALRSIFGLTGVTSAQVLLDNVDALDEYTRGVGRAGAAQKLAAANSAGLVGTLTRAKALITSDVQGIYRSIQPVINRGLKPMVDWLEQNDGQLEDQAKTIATQAVPLLKSFGRALESSARAARAAVADAKPFLPLLEDLVDLAEAGADALAAVPTPIKTLALEAGVAALVLPRLSAGVASVTGSVVASRTALTTYRSDLALTRSAVGMIGPVTKQVADAQTRMAARTAALGSAARNAAGIGGMLALVQGANNAGTALGSLELAAGGAATGFAVAGPWGAAIGGISGVLFGLKKTLDGSREAVERQHTEMLRTEALEKQKQKAAELRDTLDELTGAYTAATRQVVYKQLADSGALKSAQGLGLSARTVVSALLGQEGAQKRVNATLLAANGAYDKAAAGQSTIQGLAAAFETLTPEQQAASNNARSLAAAMGTTTSQLRDQTAAVKAQAAATQPLPKLLSVTKAQFATWPKAVRTKLALDGVPEGRKQLQAFATQVKLTRPVAEALLKVNGLEPSKRNIRALVTAMQTASNQSGGLGSGAGSSFGAGYTGGIASWIDRASATAARMAASAHAAAMRAQDSHSPSKKMQQVGKWFSQGFAIGIRKDASKALDAVESMYDRIDKAQDKILDQAPKKQRKRLQKQFRDQNRDVKKIVQQFTTVGVPTGTLGRSFNGLRKYFTASALKDGKISLREVAAAQQNLNTQLEDAKSRLADAKQAWTDYRDGIKTSVIAFGDITQIGKNAAGNATADGIVSALQTRKAAVDKYLADIQRLRDAHLNDTALQQIIDAGVDGGLQTAEAILAGGPSTIRSINTLQGQISTAAGNLGTSMANKFYGAGIQAAQGLYDGLVADKKKLEATANALATALVRAVKKKLGIKSPSRVFKELGKYTVQGLDQGLDPTQAYRSGERLAGSVVSGYGTPALDAYMATSAVSSGQVPTFQLVLTADQVDQLSRGKRIQADLDAAGSVGVRRLA